MAKTKGSAADTVVGCWKMVEAWNKDTATSPKTYPWGNPPLGYWVFDPAKNASVQISINPPLSNLSTPPSWWTLDPNAEMLNSFNNYMAYFGTYTVDYPVGDKPGSIIINVTADVLCQYNSIMQDGELVPPAQVRSFKLVKGDLLIGDFVTNLWLRRLQRVASFA